MNSFSFCYVQQLPDSKWYIMWPDCTKAWSDGYATKGWATRILKWLTTVPNQYSI